MHHKNSRTTWVVDWQSDWPFSKIHPKTHNQIHPDFQEDFVRWAHWYENFQRKRTSVHWSSSGCSCYLMVVEEAAAIRLRPVLMTTAAMVFGVVPLIALRVAIALVGTPVGAPIVGWVADQYGPSAALYVGAASGFAAALVGLYAMYRRKITPPGDLPG